MDISEVKDSLEYSEDYINLINADQYRNQPFTSLKQELGYHRDCKFKIYQPLISDAEYLFILQYTDGTIENSASIFLYNGEEQLVAYTIGPNSLIKGTGKETECYLWIYGTANQDKTIDFIQLIPIGYYEQNKYYEFKKDIYSGVFHSIENGNNENKYYISNFFKRTKNLFYAYSCVDNVGINTSTKKEYKNPNYIASNKMDVESEKYDVYGGSSSDSEAQIVGVYDKNDICLGIEIAYTSFSILSSKYSTASYFKVYLKKEVIDIFNYAIYKQEESVDYYIPFLRPELPFVHGLQSVNHNWWEGKKGDSLGDSITALGFFQKQIKAYYNLSEFKNHGINSTRLSGVDTTGSGSFWEDRRINALSSDADFITIMGGTNDTYPSEEVIGEFNMDNHDVNTYFGALNVICAKIYYKYGMIQESPWKDLDFSGITKNDIPKEVKIFVMTPTYVGGTISMMERTIKQGECCREFSKLSGIVCIDLLAKSEMNYYTKDYAFNKEVDYTHPSEDGFKKYITPTIIGYMDAHKIIDFEKVNDILTEYID